MDENNQLALSKIFSFRKNQANEKNSSRRPCDAVTSTAAHEGLPLENDGTEINWPRLVYVSEKKSPFDGSLQSGLNTTEAEQDFLRIFQNRGEAHRLPFIRNMRPAPFLCGSKSGKRKSNSRSDGSNLSPSRKQHITEEKMAACMQMLSLEAGQNNFNIPMGSLKQKNDDSDFEDDSDLEDEEEPDRAPIIKLNADFMKKIKKPESEPLLPKSIIDTMCNSSPCLALVPYVPPQRFLREVIQGVHSEIDKIEEIKNTFSEAMGEPMKVEENEFFEIDWDTDSDNDIVLD